MMTKFFEYDEALNIVAIYDSKKQNTIELPIAYAKYSNILDAVKAYKITLIKEKFDKAYRNYISKYPEVEVASFKDKATEAAKVIKDPDTTLEDTPYLSALTDYDKDKRNALAKIIDKKIKEVATLEKYASEKRDEIKACNTLEELERVVI